MEDMGNNLTLKIEEHGKSLILLKNQKTQSLGARQIQLADSLE